MSLGREGTIPVKRKFGPTIKKERRKGKRKKIFGNPNHWENGFPSSLFSVPSYICYIRSSTSAYFVN